jgi:tRNA nucleotidyltransferase (CCA-adding enzyme)
LHVQADLELFRKNELPMSLKYVDCNGYDIMQCGFTGPLIGEVFKKVVKAILTEDIENKKEQIISYIKTKI